MIDAIVSMLQNPWEFLIQTVLAELIVVVLGVLIAHFILRNWERWRYGKWHVVVLEGEETHVDRRISPAKAKQILDEPADLSVFLKGVVSPYGWIKCDLIEHGQEEGLLVVDEVKKRFVIDLDKNPDDSRPDRPTN